MGDLGKLVQVVSNLLSNASKFSHRDGTVRVHADVEAWGYVVTIDDSGPGIADEMLTQVFEPFVQGEAGLATKSGLGIGLSLVKRIVELHGGTVHAESGGLGLGARFVVRFPIGSAS
ncbi:MAG: ATP-binding protein, partial [Rhizobacter sp.]